MKRTYKNLNSLAKNVQQLSVQQLINKRAYFNTGKSGHNDFNFELTDDLINDVVDILGGTPRTKENIFYTLKNDTPQHWGLGRIFYSETTKRFSYCAGQDYPAELNQIRTFLRNY